MLLSSANYYAPKVPHSSIKYSILIELIAKGEQRIGRSRKATRPNSRIY